MPPGRLATLLCRCLTRRAYALPDRWSSKERQREQADTETAEWQAAQVAAVEKASEIAE